MKACISSTIRSDHDQAAQTVIALALHDETLAATLAARFEASSEFVVERHSLADEAQTDVRSHGAVDVLLIDERCLQSFGGPATPLRDRWRTRRVVVVADRPSAALAEQVIRYRLQGFLLAADAADICLKAIRAVRRGETWLPRGLIMELLLKHIGAANETLRDGADARLTRRETEVVGYVRRGFANKQIADALAICEDTVKKHLRNAYTKLGVHRRSELMMGKPERLPRG